eukprot:CAMPEP_0173089320 /NCGR_PEP_ID=MMETSP1102-20130122/25809_1 /TAXON_ID=49646 /ORGANISM="Geminigera sp., Strain Caron Lab Isolate" /LENGTH=80 /DNA_ID=CAMNT_0013973091 /DNA_START=742 /DNA_END=984 /DNA_ORIENTATION=+
MSQHVAACCSMLQHVARLKRRLLVANLANDGSNFFFDLGPLIAIGKDDASVAPLAHHILWPSLRGEINHDFGLVFSESGD